MSQRLKLDYSIRLVDSHIIKCVLDIGAATLELKAVLTDKDLENVDLPLDKSLEEVVFRNGKAIKLNHAEFHFFANLIKPLFNSLLRYPLAQKELSRFFRHDMRTQEAMSYFHKWPKENGSMEIETPPLFREIISRKKFGCKLKFPRKPNR